MLLTEDEGSISGKNEAVEYYPCIYTVKKTCNPLLALHKTFYESTHRSLIYKELLPTYCVNCGILKMINDSLIDEGKDWIESTAANKNE